MNVDKPKQHRHCKYFERALPSENGICIRFPPTGCLIMTGGKPDLATGQMQPVYESRGVFPPVMGVGTACGEYVEREGITQEELGQPILPDAATLERIAEAGKSETKQ